MIRVERGKEVSPGVWAYSAPLYGVEGRSRQPLLDACRQIKRMGGDCVERVGLFRPGRETCDLSCSVEVGAGLTVDEAGPWFRRWKPRDPAVLERLRGYD